MILVDTSIWVRYFAGQEPFLSKTRKLLADGKVIAHELVYVEVLMGDQGSRTQFLEDYAEFPQAALLSNREVLHFVRAHKLPGRGVGWIDVHLLASAVAGKLKLWTADPRFAAVAKELGVAYA